MLKASTGDFGMFQYNDRYAQQWYGLNGNNRPSQWVGWDLESKSVEFTTNKFGNPDVCIVIIPEKW